MTDAQGRAEKVQADVKAGFETILEKGSGILEKAKEDVGGHSESEASRSKELGKLYSIQNYFKENVRWICKAPNFFAAIDAST